MSKKEKNPGKNCPNPGCNGKIEKEITGGVESWYCPQCGAVPAGAEHD